jgi:enamine deaminase RidA (YjgF/YER057c/UK114 family)
MVLSVSVRANRRYDDGNYPDTLDEHIHQAFKNVEKALKDAGGKGFEEVYSITTYHCHMDQESLEIAVKYVKEYMKHKPIWTAVGVAALADKDMKIEVVVKAKTK